MAQSHLRRSKFRFVAAFSAAAEPLHQASFNFAEPARLKPFHADGYS